MNLTTQKRLAASILKVGLNRVWIDPERLEEVSMAITRDGVKQLIQNRGWCVPNADGRITAGSQYLWEVEVNSYLFNIRICYCI